MARPGGMEEIPPIRPQEPPECDVDPPPNIPAAGTSASSSGGSGMNRSMQQAVDLLSDAHISMMRAKKQTDDNFNVMLQRGLKAKEDMDTGWRNAMLSASLNVEKAKVKLLDVSQAMRSEIFSNLGSVVKSSILADPDMWTCARNFFGSAIDELWEEIVAEVELNIEKEILRQKAEHEVHPPKSCAGCCYDRVRAFVLFHFLPFDKTIFGKLADPAYVVMFITTFIPVHGLRVALFACLLFFLCFPGRPDEFQLLSFILYFKGNQFLSQGVLMTLIGAMQYFSCYTWHKDDFLECVEQSGPGSGSLTGQLVDYLGTVVLAWTAFFLLPCSTTAEGAKAVFIGREQRRATTQNLDGESKRKGGKLAGLLCWDIVCFLLSSSVLCMLTASSCHGDDDDCSRQFQENLFWCRVMYAFCALPFWFFMIPIFLQVLTHSIPTGFNEHGACVAFELPVAVDDQPRRARSTGCSGDGSGCGSWCCPRRRRGPGAVPSGVVPGSPRVQESFERVKGHDCFPGSNAESIAMKAETEEDLRECMAVCKSRGWGSLVVYRGNALFRSQSTLECRKNLQKAAATTVYLNWSPDVESFDVYPDRDTFPRENAQNLRVRADGDNLPACLRLCRHGPARDGRAGPLADGFGAMVVGYNGVAYFRRRSAVDCENGLVESPGSTTYVNWAHTAQQGDPAEEGLAKSREVKSSPSVLEPVTEGPGPTPACSSALAHLASQQDLDALISHAESAPPKIQEEPLLAPSTRRLQWMWADANPQLHFLAELNPLRWSELMPAGQLADRLSVLSEESRPVQVRSEGDKKSRTFPGPHFAAEWIRSRGDCVGRL